MLKGFKDFIMRGNVVDLAVGIVIGAAFTAVVTQLHQVVPRTADPSCSPAASGLDGRRLEDPRGRSSTGRPSSTP